MSANVARERGRRTGKSRDARPPHTPGRASAGPSAQHVAPRRDRGPGDSRRVLVIVAGLVVLGTIAWALWLRPGAKPEVPRAAAVDALDALPPGVAYDSALVLATAGHTLQSLPFFRRATRGVQEDFWQLHSNYASALYNLTLQKTERRGVVMGPTRSTWERTALIRESIEESTRARDLAQSPRDRVTVLMLRGRLAQVYGFPWETFAAYREARFANPGDPELRLRADQFQASLEHPTATNTIRAATGEAGVER